MILGVREIMYYFINDQEAKEILADGRGPAQYSLTLRDRWGRLVAHSFNGKAFVAWGEKEVGSFRGRPTILIGVGGAGGPMASEMAKLGISQLTLIDRAPKHKEVKTLQKMVPSVE